MLRQRRSGLDTVFRVTPGEGPILGVALHAGHELRPEVRKTILVDEATRLREEDPGTELLLFDVVPRVVVDRSRFECDFNRPRERAVYRRPEDAWGIRVWRGAPDPAIVGTSLESWDRFRDWLTDWADDAVQRHGRFVVLDVHSYNHRRRGPRAAPEDPMLNPVVNVGTGGLDRDRWADVVDPFIEALREQTLDGEPLDVRENVRFEGGDLVHWLSERWPEHACGIAVEFKKVYMDEWTGAIDLGRAAQLRRALAATLPALERALAEGR